MSTRLGTLIASLVGQHIDDPTHEMRVAFRKLPTAHKWVLYTILEAGDRPSVLSKPEDMAILEARFNTLCPTNAHRSFGSLLEETSEGFVQFFRKDGVAVGVTWIHPSCQDLTIEELANSAEDRQRFLSLCTRDGIEKALSVAGGSEGKRMLPLLTTDDDWTCLATRCFALLSEREKMVRLLLRSLSTLKYSGPRNQTRAIAKLTEIIVTLWPSYLVSVRRDPNWSWISFSNFFEMRRIAKRKEKPPQLRRFWIETVNDVLWAMEDHRLMEEAGTTLEKFYRVACLLALHEAQTWRTSAIRSLYRDVLECISTRVQSEFDSSYDYSDFDANWLEQTSRAYAELSERFKDLSSLPDLAEEFELIFQEASWHFDSQAESLSEQASEKGNGDDSRRDVVIEAAAEIEGRRLTLSKLFEDL